jgi:hypothetical protein
MTKNTKKAKVKPFKPLGNRVVTPSLKPKNYGSIPASDEQIRQAVLFSIELRRL